MIVRIWSTGVVPHRLEDYKQFAKDRSRPMFQRQSGCLGVIFADGSDRHLAITFWEDSLAVEALEGSESYRETVSALEASGFLSGAQQVEVYEGEMGFLNIRPSAS